MNIKIRRKLERFKCRIQNRLDKAKLSNLAKPVLTASNIDYEIADRTRGIAQGGIGAFHLLARRIGLVDAINDNLHLLKFHFPYHESDHVLNLAYNALCGGHLPARFGIASSGRSLPQCLGSPTHSRSDHGRRFLSAFQSR